MGHLAVALFLIASHSALRGSAMSEDARNDIAEGQGASSVPAEEPGGDGMDIHKARPWHGWREFLKEIATIVCGIVIAIALEQVVEQLHWRHEVAVARRALAAEISRNDRVFAFRVAAAPCIARRLSAIELLAERTARHEPVLAVESVMPDTGDALRDNVWQAHRASQTLTHFDDDTLALLSAYYQQLGYSNLGMTQEGESQAALRLLESDPSRLAPSDISAIRIGVQRARAVGTILAAIAREELETSERLNITAPSADAARLAFVCRQI